MRDRVSCKCMICAMLVNKLLESVLSNSMSTFSRGEVFVLHNVSNVC